MVFEQVLLLVNAYRVIDNILACPALNADLSLANFLFVRQ